MSRNNYPKCAACKRRKDGRKSLCRSCLTRLVGYAVEAHTTTRRDERVVARLEWASGEAA